MASAFTHAAAALALGTAFRDPSPPVRYWSVGAACAVIPDLDAIGYYLGVPYGGVFGHRGITHSLFFAALLATVALSFFRGVQARERWPMWLFFFLATTSHGVLDAMTTGGGGIAFFAPFENGRYFLPWRVIEVSPLSVRRFFTARGARVLVSEIGWVWTPAAIFALACIFVRRVRRQTTTAAA
jgi:inner membrane protein